MKNLLTALTVMLITTTVWAQSPDKMSYQAVIRDASDQLVINQDMGIQISILQGSTSGTTVYVETHETLSNANGLVSIEIGTGTTSDDFSAIDWTSGPYFLKTETDPATLGGTNYTITGTSQLLSVPYAQHSNTTDSIIGGVGIRETDPLFAASIASDITETDTTYWNNKKFLADNDADTKIQAEEIDDEDIIRFDLGGTERWIMNHTRLEPKNTGQSVFFGEGAGANDNLSDNKNSYVGFQAGNNNTIGSNNVFLGHNAGYLGIEGSRNTFLGYNTGYNNNGSGNVFIGNEVGSNFSYTGISNRLILDNENVDSTEVLMYGEFDQNHLRINGNIGINYQAYNSYGLIIDIPDGQTSIYTLLIYGNAWASGGTWSTSDVRFKKNIKTYENALNTIMQFRGVSYDWRVDEFPQQRFSDGRQLGFIAQEVEEIESDLVKEGPDGYKGVEYTKFTPIIVEAIKEQQQEIENLKQKIKELEGKLQTIYDKLE